MCNNGLFNTLIFNKTENPIDLTVIDDGIKNCQIFPPYQDMYSFKIVIPPKENAAILGLRLSYNSGSFNFKFQSKIIIIKKDPWEISYQNSNTYNYSYNNIGERFANYLKFNISSNNPSNNALRNKTYTFIEKDSAKQFPIFHSQNFSGDESLRQSLSIKEEISPERLIQIYPLEFNLLFKNFPNSLSPHIQKKWTKIKSSNGTYIGQINIINGDLEGRGVFFWNIGGIKIIKLYMKDFFMKIKKMVMDVFI